MRVHLTGFPHSDIFGSKVARHLPEAYRRHAASFIVFQSQGIHHMLLISYQEIKKLLNLLLTYNNIALRSPRSTIYLYLSPPTKRPSVRLYELTLERDRINQALISELQWSITSQKSMIQSGLELVQKPLPAIKLFFGLREAVRKSQNTLGYSSLSSPSSRLKKQLLASTTVFSQAPA